MKELGAAIGEYLDEHNESSKPFVWTQRAEQIPESMALFAQRTFSQPIGLTSRIAGTEVQLLWNEFAAQDLGDHRFLGRAPFPGTWSEAISEL